VRFLLFAGRFRLNQACAGRNTCLDLSIHAGYQPAKEKPRDRRTRAMSDIAERIKKIVIEHLDVDAEKVTDNASFIDDLGADSLDNVELVMAFEEEFGVEIPDDAAETIQTVGDAIRFVEKATAA